MSKRLLIPIPELGTVENATERAFEATPEGEIEGIIQPDECICTFPDDVSDDAIIAVGDPVALSRRDGIDSLSHLGLGQRRPVRLPEDTVELDAL